MSECITKVEEILTAFQTSTDIPYDYRRFRETLPDTYIVYFVVADNGKRWYEGKEDSKVTRIQISLYFRNLSTYSTVPTQIETAFMAANFMRVSGGDLPYSDETGHYGWRCDFNYYEKR